MRLGLYFMSTTHDANASWYSIAITDDEGELRDINSEDRAHLKTLMPQIEKKCRKILGEHFLRLADETETGGDLGLCVIKGTSTGQKRFDFRALSGWIELYDMAD
jgi:hypothetical protein